MTLNCEICQTPLNGTNCPQCGYSPEQPSTPIAADSRPLVLPVLHQSVPSRIFVGTLIALGVIAGAREFFIGLKSEDWLKTEAAIAAMFGVRALAGMFGGLLVGAGRDKSAPLGLMMGATASGIWAAIVMYAFRQPFSTVEVFAFGFLTMMSSAGAALGSRVWPPRAELPKSNMKSRAGSAFVDAKEIEREKVKILPTQWSRIVFAVCVSVCTFVSAPMIRDWMAQGQFMEVGGARSLPFVCVQIAGFTMLLCCMVSGAGTGIGLRQGVYAGLIAGGICATIYLARGPSRIPAGAGLVELMNWSVEKTPPQQAAAAIFGASFVIGTIGGSFGNLIFPPISKRKKRKKLQPDRQVFAE